MFTVRLIIGILLASLWSVSSADIGQIKKLTGTVHILRDGQQLTPVAGDVVQQHDTIVTGADGSVGITFVDNSRFSTGPNSELELSRFKFDTTTHEGEFAAGLNKGTLSVVSGQLAKHSPQQMKVRTPSSLLAVRGTSFLIKVGD